MREDRILVNVLRAVSAGFVDEVALEDCSGRAENFHNRTLKHRVSPFQKIVCAVYRETMLFKEGAQAS